MLLHVVVSLRTVHIVYIRRADRVELQDIVVEEEQRFAYLGAANLCGIREDAHLGRRAVDIPNLLHPFHNLGEMRVQRRLTIAGKGQHIGHDALCLKLQQFAFQSLNHLISRGQRVLCSPLLVQSALTIDAIKTAHLPAFR